jgi:hypothetical protein
MTTALQTLEARGLDVELADRMGIGSSRLAGGDIPPARLRELLELNPKTGQLTWRPRPLTDFPCEQSGKTWNARYAGKPALTAVMSGGYLKGHVLGRQYQAHRVVWAIHTGGWPATFIDHINGNRSDNSPENLRVVSRLDNARNMRRRRDNKSGAQGIRRVRSGRWVAMLADRYVGTFETFDEALAARSGAAAAAGYHPNHGGCA